MKRLTIEPNTIYPVPKTNGRFLVTDLIAILFNEAISHTADVHVLTSDPNNSAEIKSFEWRDKENLLVFHD